MIQFRGAFERLIKDRDGEVKITFTIPLSDQHEAMKVKQGQSLKITVEEDGV